MTTPRGEVYDAIRKERAHQDSQWSELDKTKSLADFLSYMWTYYRSAEKNHWTQESHCSLCMADIRKIAALAVGAQKFFGVVFRDSSKPFDGAMLGEGVFLGKQNQLQVFYAIDSERDYQDGLGIDRRFVGDMQNTIEKNPLGVGGHLTLLRHYLTKTDEAWAINSDASCLDVVRKVAAIAVRALEELGCPIRE